MDLFDKVRAAPPPTRIRENTAVDSDTLLSSPALPSPIMSELSLSPSTAQANLVKSLPTILEPDETNVCKRLQVRLKRTSIESQMSSTMPVHPVTQSGQQGQLQCPPKTKAEQKSFADAIPSDNKKTTKNTIRAVRIMIKRLTENEIALHAKPPVPPQINEEISTDQMARMSSGSHKKDDFEIDNEAPFSHDSDVRRSASRGKCFTRGRRGAGNYIIRGGCGNCAGCTMRSSGARRGKVRRNGSSRCVTNNMRVHMQSPPSTFQRINGNSKSDLIQRYGNRFFNCYIRIKRIKLYDSSPSRRSRKSNLSVSFSESVEILGGNDSSRVRSRKTSAVKTEPLPKSLLRNDELNNVVEDVMSSSSTELKSECKDKRRHSSGASTNSERDSERRLKLKRPAQCVPIMDLASLRIDDDLDDKDEVKKQKYLDSKELSIHCTIDSENKPTEMPKRVTTTTISDSEAEQETEGETNIEQFVLKKWNNKPESKTLGEGIDNDFNKRVNDANINENIKFKDKTIVKIEETNSSLNTMLLTTISTNVQQEVGDNFIIENAAKACGKTKAVMKQFEKEINAEFENIAVEGNIEADALLTNTDIDNVQISNTEDTNNYTEHTNMASDTDSVDMDNLVLDNINELVSKSIATKVDSLSTTIIDGVLPDILDIGTSIVEDRELRISDTLPQSSQLESNVGRVVRGVSIDSDASFKSANEQNNQLADSLTHMESKLQFPFNTPIESSRNVILTSTSTTNGNDGTTSQTTAERSIRGAPFSPVGDIVSLDVNELNLDAVTDFQLNSSTTELPTGNLDDIMTVLES